MNYVKFNKINLDHTQFLLYQFIKQAHTQLIKIKEDREEKRHRDL